MIRLLDILEETTKIEENQRCNNYFDMNSIKRYVEFKNPIYSIIQKHKTAKLIYLAPKQYIYRIASGFGGLSYEDAISHVNWDNVSKYAERMKNGEKAPIGYYTRGDSRQEGRHRALAAIKLNCKEIPVMELIPLETSEVEDFAKSVKGKSFEDLDKEWKDKDGFDGISRLGYNDLQRYIEYNLDD